MKLVQTNQRVGKESKSLRAVDHFKRCPLCGDGQLIRVSPEVVCSQCDWDSCGWSVSRGSMDNLFAASIEHLRGGERQAVAEMRSSDDIGLTTFGRAVGEEA